MFYSGESKTQPIIAGKELIETKRIAAIVVAPSKEKLLLLKNLDPALDMIAFPNWNLRGAKNSLKTVKELLYARTGYSDISSIDLLAGEIHRKYRKTKKDASNEFAVYKNSVYVVFLDSLKKENVKDISHALVWKSIQDMDDFLLDDGSHGSSYLLWKLFRNNNLIK